MIGSCFAESVGRLLCSDMFDVTVNPFGTLYNPASIGQSVMRLLSGKPYKVDDLVRVDGIWHSSDHHSRFSSVDAEATLDAINRELISGHEAALEADVAILTLGSSWIFNEISSGMVVANCHKRHPSCFSRTRLMPDQSASHLFDALSLWRQHRPDLKVILTVSPIRHAADGVAGNSLSKASLIVAASEVVDMLGTGAFYFPSYEVMMDDLRDYRYYASDMKHPSDEAVDYIYRVFCQSVMTAETVRITGLVRKLAARIGHRSLVHSADAERRRDADIEAIASDIISLSPSMRPRIESYIHQRLKSHS